MSVAFVLSGGASLGAIQVGMLRALVDHDVRPDLIVGTSVGAVNGAFVACRGLTAQTVDELAALWLDIRRSHVFPVAPLVGLLGFAGARTHLVPVGSLRRLIRRHTDRERLEDLPTPLHVIACDLLTGQEVRLSEGPLVDAVLASAAVPGVLPPVDWGGRLLIDGGVLNNTPITHALELGADEVYVLSTGTPSALAQAPRGALGMVVHATSLIVARRFADESFSLAGRADVTILPPPSPIGVQPMDFTHAADLMAQAEASARAFLEERPRTVVPIRTRRSRGPVRGLRAAELPPTG
jgi:NTE family protein